MPRAAPPEHSLRFADRLEDSSRLATGVKVQVWGGAETGKSHDAYEVLPRPLVVVDADVSASQFADDRFLPFKRLGPDAIPDFQACLAFLEEFTTEPRWHRTYRSLLIDSLTQLVDPQVAALGIDNSSVAIGVPCRTGAGPTGPAASGRAQADWARAAKALTRLIRQVSALGVHVYVIAEARTRFIGGRPGAGDDGLMSSLSPRKFTHAFDLIVHKRSRDDVVVRKSRYRHLVTGQAIADYRAVRDLKPLLGGAAAPVADLATSDPSPIAHEEFLALLRSLGTIGRGGRIPAERMRTYLAAARDRTLQETVVRSLAVDVHERYGRPAG
jgi:hypothetical protein